MPEKDKDQIIAALRSEISMLKSVLYKMPGNIYWKSLDDKLLGCNINCAKTLQANSPEEVIGKTTDDFLSPELASKLKEIDRKILETEIESTTEEEGHDDDGKYAVWLSRKSPFYDDEGKLIGLIGISVDITQQKKTEDKLRIAKKKAEEANHAKSKFLAMVSHELRIPLTSIIGFAGFLQQENLSSTERQTYIQHLNYSSDYLFVLINKLLDYSKLDANKLKLKPVSCSLKKIANDIEGMLGEMVRNKNLEFVVDIDPNIPQKIMTDVQALQQILINLVSNAVKFTKKGKITFKMDCLEKNDETAKIKITVQDTGVGIPANKLKTIFKEFYQVDDIYTRSTSIMGTGLGLSIVKKLVKLMQGKITVSSRINQGSTFSIAIDFPISQHTKLQDTSDQGYLGKKQQQSRGRILLVEDDALVQFVHNKMLKNLGYQVNAVENGQKALDLLSNNYDLIFVDLGLPDINGFDLIKMIRAQKEYSKLPIIALTGFYSDKEKTACIKAGANEMMAKPISQTMLQEMIGPYILGNKKK